jgi:hypothetical protein
MSEQHEMADSTSLEEVFNSQQFGRASGTTRLDEVVVTKEFRVATRVAAPVLVGLHNPPLEDVLHSARDRTPLTLVAPLQTGAPGAGALPAEEGAVARLELRRSEHTRYRAIAAVSGVAAAALVVAGVTSGTVQRRPSSVSAQGPRTAARSPGAFGPAAGAAPLRTPAPSGLTPTATFAAAVGVAAGPTAFTAASPAGPGRASTGQVHLGGPGGTKATAPPAPTGVTAPGAGGGSGSPPAPSLGGSPAAPVTSAVASTVTAVGTSVTSVADQLGGSVPMTTPVTSAVSTVVSGIGQAVGSTTG